MGKKMKDGKGDMGTASEEKKLKGSKPKQEVGKKTKKKSKK